jgi:hypothetical protein
LLVLVDQGFQTGRAAYAPTAFYDTSLDGADVNHAFTAQLAWQAMPRLKLSASDVFTQSDEPSQADRLDLRRGRQRFTDNLLSLTGDYVIDVYDARLLSSVDLLVRRYDSHAYTWRDCFGHHPQEQHADARL